MHKVGIIGLGFIGKMHLATLRKTGMVEVIAVADKSSANLAEGAATGGNIALDGDISLDGVKKYEDGDELLRNPDVDTVLIALPTFMHKLFIMKAIEANKNIICEKPMVRSTEEGIEVLKALEGYDKSFMTAQCIRFWPSYAKAHEIMQAGTYGKVLSAHFVRNSPKPTWSWEGWLLDNPRGGGGILDLHIHDVDYVNHCFGKPTTIEAKGIRYEKEGIGDVMAVYFYDDGKVVSINGGWNYHPTFPFRMAFRILLEGASIEFNSQVDDKLHVHTAEGEEVIPELVDGDGYLLEHKYFFDCLDKGIKPTIVTPQSAVDAIELVEREVDAIS